MSEKESNEEFLKRIGDQLNKKFLSLEDIKNGDIYFIVTMIYNQMFSTISSKDTLPKNIHKHFVDVKKGALPKEIDGIKNYEYTTFIFKMDNIEENRLLIDMGKEILKTDD